MYVFVSDTARGTCVVNFKVEEPGLRAREDEETALCFVIDFYVCEKDNNDKFLRNEKLEESYLCHLF